MSHVRSLHFDSLEARKLLTKTHLATVHSVPAVVAAPLVLSGTLTVDNKAGTSMTNLDGSTTNMVPVAGRLGALGEVRGVWNESLDSFGDYEGPDIIQLHAAKGTFTITFSNATPGPTHTTAAGAVYYQHSQRAGLGTGVFKSESETGSIQLVLNHAKTVVQSMVLDTTGT